MSKVINFNAREFGLDKSATNNLGERVFITTPLGTAEEVWEIGDWMWNWSQIAAKMTLQKNTDYLLRFAMLGGINDTGDAVSQAVIYATDGYDTPEQGYEERQIYALDKSRYQPVISKSDNGGGLLRLFEIPFNTGEHERYKILFVAMHAKASFFAPREYTAYEPLKDLTYNEWWENRRKLLNGQNNHKDGLYADMSGTNISLGSIQKLMREMPSDAYIDLSGCNVYVDAEEDIGDRSNGNSGEQPEAKDESSLYTERQFAEFLKNIGNGAAVTKRFIINADDGETYDIGASVDGAVIDLSASRLTARAFSMIAGKLGDGCDVGLTGITVTDEGIGNMYPCGGKSDGAIIDLSGSLLTARAFSMIVRKLGDGCVVKMTDMTVTADGIDNMYPCGDKSDGTVIDLTNSTIPQKALELLNEKSGDGFVLTTDNVIVK